MIGEKGYINAREISRDSFAYGEIVIDKVIVKTNHSRNQKKAFDLKHGDQVLIIDEYNENEQPYLKIKFADKEGWILKSFISTEWSIFIFIGEITPQKCCEKFLSEFNVAGYETNISKSNFSISTEGSAKDFDSIRYFAEKISQSISLSLSIISNNPLEFKISHWIEFCKSQQNQEPVVGNYINNNLKKDIIIDNLVFTKGISFINKMVEFRPLFLSMNDYYQALLFPDSAIIFLSRAIETIENYFFYQYGGEMKNLRNSRERVMREKLGIEKKDVDFVMKCANDNLHHARHASKSGEIIPIPEDELEKCHVITKRIIESFKDFLQGESKLLLCWK